MLRDIVVFLCEKLEKFSIDERTLVSNGLVRDRYIEQQYSKCKVHTQKWYIEQQRNLSI